MLNELHSLVARALVLVGGFDPHRLSGSEARTAVEEFVALEKYAAAGRLLAVGRLDETGAWFGDGTFRDRPQLTRSDLVASPPPRPTRSAPPRTPTRTPKPPHMERRIIAVGSGFAKLDVNFGRF